MIADVVIKSKIRTPVIMNIFFRMMLTVISLTDQRISFLNKDSFPLKGGYLMAGSNQVGVFRIDLR